MLIGIARNTHLLVMSHHRSPMSVSPKVVQLSRPLMILIVRAVAVAFRHLETHDLARFGIGCFGQPIRTIRVFLRPLGMPTARDANPFFIVFGSSAVGLCRQVVLLGRFAVCLRGKFVPFSGFPVFLVHRASSYRSVVNSDFSVHEVDHFLRDRKRLPLMAL